MARVLVGLIIGLVASMATIFVVQKAGHIAYPLPADLDLNDPESAARLFTNIPLPAKLVFVSAWFLGALAGGFAAGAIARRDWPGWTVAAATAALAIVIAFMVPQPAWMQMAAVVAPLLGNLAANHLRARGAGGGANDPA